MNDKETITVYWAPALFNTLEQSWDMLYSEPESILKKFLNESLPKAEIAMCPSVKQTFKNIFSLNSNIEDFVQFDGQELSKTQDFPVFLPGSKVSFLLQRKASFTNYLNINYNLKWLFFSEETLQARLSAPFFPAKELCKNALFSPGEFDIGSWFRAVSLDWHIPIETKEIKIEEDQELAYLEFFTNKKVIFKRFLLSPKLAALAEEAAYSPKRYGKNLSLAARYNLAKKAGIREIILKEIKSNLI